MYRDKSDKDDASSTCQSHALVDPPSNLLATTRIAHDLIERYEKTRTLKEADVERNLSLFD
jgi:hypothetical protein